jgi:hypothetical protein
MLESHQDDLLSCDCAVNEEPSFDIFYATPFLLSLFSILSRIMFLKEDVFLLIVYGSHACLWLFHYVIYNKDV